MRRKHASTEVVRQTDAMIFGHEEGELHFISNSTKRIYIHFGEGMAKQPFTLLPMKTVVFATDELETGTIKACEQREPMPEPKSADWDDITAAAMAYAESAPPPVLEVKLVVWYGDDK